MERLQVFTNHMSRVEQHVEFLDPTYIDYECQIRNIPTNHPDPNTKILALQQCFAEEKGNPSAIPRLSTLNTFGEFEYIDTEIKITKASVTQILERDRSPDTEKKMIEKIVSLFWRTYRLYSCLSMDNIIPLCSTLFDCYLDLCPEVEEDMPTEELDYIGRRIEAPSGNDMPPQSHSQSVHQSNHTSGAISRKVAPTKSAPMTTSELAHLPTPVRTNHSNRNRSLYLDMQQQNPRDENRFSLNHLSRRMSNDPRAPHVMNPGASIFQTGVNANSTQSNPINPPNMPNPAIRLANVNQLLNHAVPPPNVNAQSAPSPIAPPIGEQVQNNDINQLIRAMAQLFNQQAQASHHATQQNNTRTPYRPDIPKELLKLKILYTGDKEGMPYDVYVDNIEKLITHLNVPLDSVMPSIHVTLKGDPSVWYHGTFQSSTEQTWDKFVTCLQERFEESCTTAELIARAGNIKFNGSGNILQHVDRITTMLRRAQIDEKTQIDIIRSSLPRDMMRTMKQERPTSLGTLTSLFKNLFPEFCPTATDFNKRGTQSDFPRKNSYNDNRNHRPYSSNEVAQSPISAHENSNINVVDQDSEDDEDRDYDFSDQFINYIAQVHAHEPMVINELSRVRNQKAYNLNNVTCFHCQKTGHFSIHCPIKCDINNACIGNPRFCETLKNRKN